MAELKNLGEFLKKYSQQHGNKVAYQIKRGLRTQRFTFDQVRVLTLKTATFLASKGLKKGDRVAIWAPNMPEYPILYFGVWALGAVAVPIDIRTTEETLKVFLTKAKCKLGFKGKFIPGNFGRLVEESFYLEELVEIVGTLSPPRWKDAYTSEVSSDNLAEIAFTSGTTGTPKGVMLTHGNFLSDVESLTEAFPFEKNWQTLSLLPLSHAFEQVVDFLATFKTGITVTYLERINALTIIKALRKNQITSVVLVPQALRLLMNGVEREVEKQGKTKQFENAQKIASYLPIPVRRLLFRKVHKQFGGKLKFFGSGSAPLDLKLAQKWESLGIEIFEGYGATETTAAATINTPTSKCLGSVGKSLPQVDIQINETGEILVKGSNIFPGYFEDEEKTKAAFNNGWYKTGDIGEIDKGGFLYITGREAFRIVLPDGRKVYPEDLEKKLNAHPLVKEACVVGVKKDEGEAVHAAIITNHPQKLDQIVNDINKNLESHEQILSFSHWEDDDFPRTPILKIDRRKVLEVVGRDRTSTSDVETKLHIGSEDKLTALIAQVTKQTAGRITEVSTLAGNLKLDSLGRVELLSLIEQEFAVAISETKITAQTTVKELRQAVKGAPTTAEEIPTNEFMYSPFMMSFRAYALQNIFFRPLHSLFVPLEVHGKENLKKANLPAIFYFNHVGIFDALCVLRNLPNAQRAKLVTVVNESLWHDYRKWWVEIFGAGFPFDQVKRVKASLELTGDFLDGGFSVLLSPEGKFSKTGKLLEFKPGIGLLAVQMQVPVIPFKIDPAYHEIFPPMGGSFWENFPKKRKKIKLSIGRPMIFAKNTSYDQAAKQMKDAIEKL